MFNNIAKAVNTHRLKSGLTQLQLSKILGYQNGQFISNVERGQCSIPLKKVTPLIDALGCTVDDITDPMIDDYVDRINNNL